MTSILYSKFRYIDPEKSYENSDEGFRTKFAATTGQARVNINALLTKPYLEVTIVPTVMCDLHEVCHAHPDNLFEFLTYYILKHNSNRKAGAGAADGLKNELELAANIGHADAGKP